MQKHRCNISNLKKVLFITLAICTMMHVFRHARPTSADGGIEADGVLQGASQVSGLEVYHLNLRVPVSTECIPWAQVGPYMDVGG